MKKLTKLCLLVASVFGGFGVVLCIAGFVLGGGTAALSAVRNSIWGNPFVHSVSWGSSADVEYISDDIEYVDGGVRETAVYASEDGVSSGSEMPYKYAADSVKGLDVGLTFGTLNIYPSEDHNIYVHLNGSGRCKMENGILEIKELSSDNAEIFVPSDYVFKTVDIEIETGNVYAESIKADGHVELSTETGGISVITLEAGSASISTDAGVVGIESSRVSGNTKLETDTGSIDYWPKGSSTDYNYFISTNTGSVYVDGEVVSGFSQKRTIDNNAKVQINAEAEFGDINIYF